MSKWGSHLSSRSLGREVKGEIERQLLSSKSVTVDFSGICVVTHSFADESFGPFLNSMGIKEFKKRIRFVNATSNVSAMVTYALRERWKQINQEKDKSCTSQFCAVTV